ncbi:MAG TPA: hypothetical protein VFI73_01285 [Candidatus Nitrosopolaris sp.]|nr:hypothetical protein [Candidatus Nitrosopolaris sp.]
MELANKIPPVDYESIAWARRQVVLPFPNTFVQGCCAIQEYGKKLTTQSELSGLFILLMWTLKAIPEQEVLLPRNLTVEKQREKYERATDPIGKFLEEAIPEDLKANDQITKEALYKAFEHYCKKHRLPKMFPNLLKRVVVFYNTNPSKYGAYQRCSE